MTDITPEAATKGLPDIEDVAAYVHGAWVAHKRSEGVTSRSDTAGREQMVAYEHLTEAQKEIDRVTVRAVYAAIRAASRSVNADERAADVDLVHNLILGGFADDVDPLDHLGVEDDVIVLQAPGRVLRVTVERS